VLWSQLRQLPPAVDSSLDPMLVEVAIQVPPPNRRSASETGHEDMATIVVDNPSDVQPVLTLPKEMVMLGAPRDSSSDDDVCRPASPRPVKTLEARLCLPL
jgi:hypothetical protein